MRKIAKKRKNQQPKALLDNSDSGKIRIKIDEISEGEAMQISNIGGQYVVSPIVTRPIEEASVQSQGYIPEGKSAIEDATFDFSKTEHLLEYINESTSNEYITNPKELKNLAQNTQKDKSKVMRINSITRYEMNKNEIVGLVTQSIENNINVNYSMDYGAKPTTQRMVNRQKKVKKLIEDFNESIDIPQFIEQGAFNTYTKGNEILYLMGDKDRGYSYATYPLEAIEITELKIDKEPVVSFNVSGLKSKLNTIKSKYRNTMGNDEINMETMIEDEIQRNYPNEVYQAYLDKKSKVFLSPKRTGVSRVNDFGGRYGVTPIFRALTPLLILETIDNVDRKNIIAKSKKMYVQFLSDKLLADPKDKSMHIYKSGVQYAQTAMTLAMGEDTALYTASPIVDRIDLVEPKLYETNADTIMEYKNRAYSALGIGFFSSSSKSSYNTTDIVFKELLKTINKITRQLERILNKWYQVVCEDNGLSYTDAPKIKIQSTLVMDTETKLKFLDAYYGKLGLSYQTNLEILGLDYQEEIRRRQEENEYETVDSEGNKVKGMDNVFAPHGTSYTMSGKDNSSGNTNEKSVDNIVENNTTTSKTTVDKKLEDKSRYQSKV